MSRKGSSGMGSSGNISTNSTSQEKSVAKALNQGNWNKASGLMNSAGVGSTISVGNSSYKKTSPTQWKTTNTSGNPVFLTTGQTAQEISAETYNGSKAKVHIV